MFIIPVLINALFWSIKPVLEKVAVASIGYFDFALILYIFAGIISLIIWNLSFIFRKKRITHFLKGPHLSKIAYWGVLIATISLAALFAQYYLLSNNEACKVIGIVEGTTALFGVVLAWLFLKERMSPLRWFGIISIAIGILSLNYG
mgnify:CR=1 FL=1